MKKKRRVVFLATYILGYHLHTTKIIAKPSNLTSIFHGDCDIRFIDMKKSAPKMHARQDAQNSRVQNLARIATLSLITFPVRERLLLLFDEPNGYNYVTILRVGRRD